MIHVTSLSPASPRIAYLAIFGIAMTTLSQQIMITRLFSATMYYHFAFAIVSLTMLGMTIGALAVFLYPHRFPFRSDLENLSFFSAAYALSSMIAILLQTTLEFLSSPTNSGLILNLLIFLPGFICSGIVITLLLTKGIGNVSRLYASDLSGAALGCLLTLVALDVLGAVNGLLLSACIPAGVAFLCARWTGNASLALRARAIALLITALTAVNTLATFLHQPLFHINHAKGMELQSPEQDFWNSYSHVTIYDLGKIYITESCAGLGKDFKDYKADFKKIYIDSTASTVMMRYTGDPSEIAFLNYDITNSGYRMRPVHSAAIIGVGGGRDVLSALAGGATDILGMEMNKSIIRSLTTTYAGYAGISADKRITLVNDEGRSYLTRQPKTFDLIQLSMIDTWAATAAGAFSLSENALYTVEAWRSFFSKLNDHGMLALTRWYMPKYYKDELYRLMSLARATLTEEGITDPRKHVVVLAKDEAWFASVILSKSEITAEEVQRLKDFARQKGFDILLTPDEARTPDLAHLLESDRPKLEEASALLDLTPPRDNRPFFFNTLGFWQSVSAILSKTSDVRTEHEKVGMLAMNFRATEMLLCIFFTVLILTAALILFPLWKHGAREKLQPKSAPYLLYFAMLGLGFMFIEVTQMQRLMIFLGHPTYALVVVLCALLIASGAGSFVTDRIGLSRAGLCLLALCAVLLFIGIISDPLLHHFRGEATPVRIAVALLTLLPIGFFMGMGFPFGMKLAAAHGRAETTPWFWGVNGATSVLASVLALMVAIFNGIDIAYWCGVGCYVVGMLVFWRIQR